MDPDEVAEALEDLQEVLEDALEQIEDALEDIEEGEFDRSRLRRAAGAALVGRAVRGADGVRWDGESDGRGPRRPYGPADRFCCKNKVIRSVR